MFISKKRWEVLEKKVSDLEKHVQGQTFKFEIKPDDPLHRQKDYLSLAVLFQTSVDIVKDNYDILVQQCREAGII